ncbi:MAG TPA: tRNA (adenosine(37)-N6)-dimethylallyltransferase MiaA [Candidatus Limnocylindria bacterium]|jgi:tRNA dimethylallyltransferase|nr:tRNA (adenosine(37)-N6)-dimethylallyltransferase MiaA [Candidatus Limnocylindria bacterium]
MTAPILLAGPTASGKSAVALALARELGGEIISVDSMQVYRGLDLGTAKPTAAERAEIPHHLIDVAELTESFDSAKFITLANAAVAAIQQRGRVPILCGGTGLYFTVWLNGLGDSPPPDAALRAELEAKPLAELLDELARLDLVTFDEIDLDNRRRVVRAVEVIRITGKPFSQQRAAWPERAPALAGRSFGLLRTREDLYLRINRRVDEMFAAGLIEETRGLLTRGLEGNRTAMQAIGYRQVVEQLRGARGRLETIELVKQRTRQFSKRQSTWFRGQLDLDWLELAPAESPETTARRLHEKLIGAQSVEARG